MAKSDDGETRSGAGKTGSRIEGTRSHAVQPALGEERSRNYLPNALKLSRERRCEKINWPRVAILRKSRIFAPAIRII